jgi:hypothetical protein
VEAALWSASLFGRTVLWRGQQYRLLRGGRIERIPPERRRERTVEGEFLAGG